MGANDHQHGGNHYQVVGGEQHWDRLVRLYGLDVAYVYFVGNITAYVERYRLKGGIKDLEKARHYIDKLIELEVSALCKRREAENNKERASLPLDETQVSNGHGWFEPVED